MAVPSDRPGTLPAAAELVERISWLVTLRWLAIAGVICAATCASVLLRMPLAPLPIVAVMAALALYNLLLATVNRPLPPPPGTDAASRPPATAALRVAEAPAQLLKVWLAIENLAFLLAGALRGRDGTGPWRWRTLADVLVPRELWGVEREGEVLRAATLASAQITVDLVALAALLHFSGGVENPFIFYSVFHVVIASVLLSRRATYLEATLGFSLIASVGVGELYGVLAHYPLGAEPVAAAYRSATFVASQLLVLGSTLFLTAYMATSIAAGQRSYEREAARLASEVARKARQLETSNAMLREAERAKSQYMRKVAHELKAPLAAVQMLLRVVLDGLAGDLPGKSRDLVARAERRTRELSRLTQDLLALSRAREGTTAVELVPCDLGGLVAELVSEMHGQATQAGVTLAAEVTPGTPPLRGDATGLRQLVGNLVGNALRYTPEGGRVVIRVAPVAAALRLEVEDTGIGIQAADLPRIFEEFYRAANARSRSPEGTGLGLAIVRTVAERHGGTVAVASEVGRGTRFTVDLPIERTARA